jgi:hypothetical protein
MLRANDCAILMRMGCLESVPHMRFDVLVVSLTPFFSIFHLFPPVCAKDHITGSYNSVSLCYVCCKMFLIADCTVFQCQEPKPSAHFEDPTFLLMCWDRGDHYVALVQQLTSVFSFSWHVQYLMTGHGIVTPGLRVQQSMTVLSYSRDR